MVYAFIIHTLFPGSCRILFNQVYGTDGNDQTENDRENQDEKTSNKQKIEFVASQIHSEYQFRRTVANRTVETDIQAISQDDQLPEFELGFLRQAPGDVFNKERTIVWMGAGNTGFALICDKHENRVLAETVLKLLIRYLQEYLRVLHQPAESSLKAERVCAILGDNVDNHSNRVVNIWNSLPDSVISVGTIFTFEERLDRYWKDVELVYNHNAILQTGRYKTIDIETHEVLVSEAESLLPGNQG